MKIDKPKLLISSPEVAITTESLQSLSIDTDWAQLQIVRALKLVIVSIPVNRGTAATLPRLLEQINGASGRNRMTSRIIVLLSPLRSDMMGLWVAQNDFIVK